MQGVSRASSAFPKTLKLEAGRRRLRFSFHPPFPSGATLQKRGARPGSGEGRDREPILPRPDRASEGRSYGPTDGEGGRPPKPLAREDASRPVAQVVRAYA